MFDIPGAITAVSNLVDNVVKRIWPDATEIEKFKIDRFKQEMQNEVTLILGQLDINKAEAQSPSLLVSGWRPFVGWICGLALLYAALLEPFFRFLAVVLFSYSGPFPDINTEITFQVLIGMLGFGGYRSFDKFKGVAR